MDGPGSFPNPAGNQVSQAIINSASLKKEPELPFGPRVSEVWVMSPARAPGLEESAANR